MKFINEYIERCHNERQELSKNWQATRVKLEKANILNRAKRQEEYDRAFNELLNYSRGVYAKAIYDAYSIIKPNLLAEKTGEMRSWDDLFDEEFEQLDAMHCDILVGLIEGGWYKVV